VYVAEGTSDIDSSREALRRQLAQLGFDVQPTRDLRLLPAREIRDVVRDALGRAQLAIHPVGGYYGLVPEGADGKSLVQLQLELAQAEARSSDVGRMIWVPEGLVALEEAQQQFLSRIRTSFAGHGFELLERPFRALETWVVERLQSAREAPQEETQASGVYL